MTGDNVVGSVPPINHIGAVVRDIEKTARFLSSMFGFGPWQNLDLSYKQEDLTMGGPCRTRVCGARLGPVILELIQPVEGESIWSDFIKTRGEGLHHISFHVPDWEEKVSQIKKMGCKLIAEGVRSGPTGLRWCYFHTNPGGMLVEYVDISANHKPLFTISETNTGTQPDLYHINVAIKNLDKTTQFLSSLWGLGPWQTVDQTLDKDWMEIISGKPCKIKVGFCKLDPILLELIQPVEGDSFWSQFIEAKGEGINHLAFSVSDWKENALKLEENGGRMVTGGVQGGMHWGYFETRPGGIIVEFEEKMGGKQQFDVE